MASLIPAKLKAAAPDVSRFATRAAQLQKFRPIVAYWCEYYILQQILNRQLHTTDEECTTYALQLMDKLEQYKADNSTNDAVIDDVAAKVYMENFALETFNRGDEAQRNNKVTKQTADTFQASATFMDVLTIWGPLEPEIAAKNKFAKFHALRIAKAYKSGHDPNETNPVVEQPPEPGNAVNMDEAGLEAELKDLENDAGVYKQPTVESAPESQIPTRSPSALPTGPMAPPPPVLPITTDEAPQPDISPIESSDPAADVSRTASIGGGYFPSIPDAPSAPSDPADFYKAPPPSAPTPHDLGILPHERPGPPTPHRQIPSPPIVAPLQPPPPAAAPARYAPPAAGTATGPPPGGYRTDDEAVLAAQKHAKWAISALNFEDVNTAVKELRIALNSLGAN